MTTSTPGKPPLTTSTPGNPAITTSKPVNPLIITTKRPTPTPASRKPQTTTGEKATNNVDKSAGFICHLSMCEGHPDRDTKGSCMLEKLKSTTYAPPTTKTWPRWLSTYFAPKNPCVTGSAFRNYKKLSGNSFFNIEIMLLSNVAILGSHDPFCTGAIISAKVAMTSASCALRLQGAEDVCRLQVLQVTSKNTNL